MSDENIAESEGPLMSSTPSKESFGGASHDSDDDSHNISTAQAVEAVEILSAKQLFKIFLRKLTNAAQDHFSIDLRSLGMFRMSLGIMIMLDVMYRFQNIDAFYTDTGILSREKQLSDHGDKNYGINLANYRHSSSDWSIYMAVGLEYQVQILFCIHIVMGFLLCVGYKTKFTSFFCWMFQHSLHARHPTLQHRGDELFRLCLLWSVFLPIGRRWSVDSIIADRATAAISKKDDRVRLKDPNSEQRAFNFAIFILQVQIFVVYFLAAWAKDGDDWVNGYAAHKTLKLDCFIKPNIITSFLSNSPRLCYVSHWATLGLEWVGPFTLFLGPRMKFWTIISFAAMQGFFYFTLFLWLFPFVSVTLTFPLIPTEFWDNFESLDKFVEQAKSIVNCVLDHTMPKSIVVLQTDSSPTSSRIKKLIPWLNFILKVAVMMIFIVPSMGWHLVALKLMTSVPEPIRYMGLSTGAAQNWDMFAPTVMDGDGWIMMPGVLADGTFVDAIGGVDNKIDVEKATERWTGVPSYYKPRHLYEQMPSIHWFHTMLKLNRKEGCERSCQAVAGWICRRWNDGVHGPTDPEKKLQAFKLVFVSQPTVKGMCQGFRGNTSIPCAKEVFREPVLLWRHKCFPNSALPAFTVGPPTLRELQEINGMNFSAWAKQGRRVNLGPSPDSFKRQLGELRANMARMSQKTSLELESTETSLSIEQEESRVSLGPESGAPPSGTEEPELVPEIQGEMSDMPPSPEETPANQEAS